MNDQDIIRKAVELADGFGLMPGWDEAFYVEQPWDELSSSFKDPDQWMLDALAAQLVRQVDALPVPRFLVDSVGATLYGEKGQGTFIRGPDRTMNTLRAIVESKVLEEGK